MKKLNNTGFTLIELLIATTVFSVILLLCTYGLIAVGRSYYKGVTVARTQEVARNIMDDITQSIQFSGGEVVPSLTNGQTASLRGFCVDNRRYSYIVNKLLTDNPNDHAFVVDRPDTATPPLQPCSAGTPIQDITAANLNGGSPKEFLLPNMRVAEMSVSRVPGSDKLYTVRVKIASGDDEALEQEGTSNVRCSNAALNSQFCAIADLTSIVEKRLE